MLSLQKLGMPLIVSRTRAITQTNFEEKDRVDTAGQFRKG